MLQAGFRIGVFMVVAMWSATALAAPDHVRVSWDKEDTAHTMAVTWTTQSLGDASIVDYGLDTSYGDQATGSNFQANGALGVIHSVSISELEPSTLYHYRVGGPGAWSGDYTFQTGPVDGCSVFRFIALGDNRGDTGSAPSSHWNPILTEALAHGPSFVLNTGDLVKDGDDDAQWEQFLEASGDGIAHTPLMPSLGNHDDDKIDGDGASYNQLFTLPRNTNSGSEDYYYFRYGDALFVALSTATFMGGVTQFAEQAKWLDELFTNEPATWRFVYFHHPPYSGTVDLFGIDVGDIAHPPNELGQNSALVPIFDKHHVDIVFNGHNHFYQRFEPMCCGGGGDEGVPTGDPSTGTMYMITGGAGALTYDLSFLGIDIMDLLCGVTGSVHCDGRHHYVMLEVDGLDLTAKVYTTASQLLGADADNIELIDEFTIHKEGAEGPCGEAAADPDPDASDVPSEVEETVSGADAPASEDLGPTPAPDSGPGAPETTSEPDLPGAPDQPTNPTEPGTGAPAGVEIGSDPGGSSKKSSGCGGAGEPGSSLLLLLMSLMVCLTRRPETE